MQHWIMVVDRVTISRIPRGCRSVGESRHLCPCHGERRWVGITPREVSRSTRRVVSEPVGFERGDLARLEWDATLSESLLHLPIRERVNTHTSDHIDRHHGFTLDDSGVDADRERRIDGVDQVANDLILRCSGAHESFTAAWGV
jgi:hypothetical protein